MPHATAACCRMRAGHGSAAGPTLRLMPRTTCSHPLIFVYTEAGDCWLLCPFSSQSQAPTPNMCGAEIECSCSLLPCPSISAKQPMLITGQLRACPTSDKSVPWSGHPHFTPSSCVLPLIMAFGFQTPIRKPALLLRKGPKNIKRNAPKPEATASAACRRPVPTLPGGCLGGREVPCSTTCRPPKACAETPSTSASTALTRPASREDVRCGQHTGQEKMICFGKSIGIVLCRRGP